MTNSVRRGLREAALPVVVDLAVSPVVVVATPASTLQTPMTSSSELTVLRNTELVLIVSCSTFFSSMGGGGGGAENIFASFGGGGSSRGGPRMRTSRMGGGMGGMGGMPGMGGMGGMPGGFGDEPSSSAPPPGEIIKPLALSLEELYKGGTKRLKITRHLQSGGQAEKILEVAYKAGWKKGTKIKFAGAGNEDEYGQSQYVGSPYRNFMPDANVASFRTVTFVVEEKPHNRFERVDDDLVVKLNITLSQALLGPDGGGAITKEVEQLDGRRIQVSLPEGVRLDFLCSMSIDADLLYPANRPARTRNTYSRRGYACLKGQFIEEERRSCCQVECCLPYPIVS